MFTFKIEQKATGWMLRVIPNHADPALQENVKAAVARALMPQSVISPPSPSAPPTNYEACFSTLDELLAFVADMAGENPKLPENDASSTLGCGYPSAQYDSEYDAKQRRLRIAEMAMAHAGPGFDPFETMKAISQYVEGDPYKSFAEDFADQLRSRAAQPVEETTAEKSK